MKKVLFTTNLLMGLVLSRFAISKLAAWETSVKSFIEMAKPLSIDPALFRISTGVLISFVVIGYLTTAVFSLTQKNLIKTGPLNFKKWAILSNLLGLLTMVGALVAEFFLRTEPKWSLVYIALGIIAFSAINILIVNKRNQIRKSIHINSKK